MSPRKQTTVRDAGERFLERIAVQPEGCWLWLRVPNGCNGYGRFGVRQARHYVHRFAYEMWVGPILDGYEIDHTCHNSDKHCRGNAHCLHRRCVNPDHLEAVPHQVNVQRGRVGDGYGKTHCKDGHALTGDNLAFHADGTKLCRLCVRENQRQWYRRHVNPDAYVSPVRRPDPRDA